MEKILPITLIGSLPHSKIEEAIWFVFENNIIPCLPELPRLGEEMLDYIKNPGNLTCAPAFKKRYAPIKKIQCVGTCTLVHAAKMPVQEANRKIYTHITGLLDGLRADKVILFLDEPIISLDCQKLWAGLFEMFDKDPGLNNIILGVHTCNNMNWDQLFSVERLKIVSFDASSYGDSFIRSRKYRNGKAIAWGVQKPEDVKDFQEGDLITPPCGLSPLNYQINDCLPVLRNLQKIASDILAE